MKGPPSQPMAACERREDFDCIGPGIESSVFLQEPHGFGAKITLWLFNIAMENSPFIDGLPIKNGDFPWLC